VRSSKRAPSKEGALFYNRQTVRFFALVEAAGIEPASEKRSMQVSTCVVRGLIPPSDFPTDWTSEGPPLKISPERPRHSSPANLQQMTPNYRPWGSKR